MAWIITAIAAAGSAVATGTAAAASALGVSTGAFVAGSAVAGTTALGARGQYVAGKTQEIELKRRAEEERLAAQSRELQRREELNRALASNVVGQAMSGISGEGTPASIALASAKKAGLSESTIGLSEKLKQAQLRRQASSARKTGYLASTSTLLKGVSQVASIYSDGKSAGSPKT
tara:strand:+ start:40 stop:567 length:528 start_codon:yes stop_codon:yes gene_type:complete